MNTEFLTAPDRACVDADTDLFVPEPKDEPAIEAALAHCRVCQYTAECRQWADEVGDYHAVLGGTTGPERAASAGRGRTARQIAVAARREDVKHLMSIGLDTATIAKRVGASPDVVLADKARLRAAA